MHQSVQDKIAQDEVEGRRARVAGINLGRKDRPKFILVNARGQVVEARMEGRSFAQRLRDWLTGANRNGS